MIKNKAVSLSIIIPCYNEENNLKRGVLQEVSDFLSRQKFTYEVLICNDGSTDTSLPTLRNLTSKLPHFKILDLPHGGKPSAIWGGIQQAQYDHILFTDMDQSTPISEINNLLPWFNHDYDVVIGSRGTLRDGNSLVRKIGSRVFLFFRRLFLLGQIIDTQCGFKAMTTSSAKDIFPNLQFFKDKTVKKGWRVSAYDVELLFIAQKWGYKIKEIPVIWKNEDTSDTKGDFNTRYKKESIQMVKEIKRVITNNLKGKYDRQN